jgi:hypothetical protein
MDIISTVLDWVNYVTLAVAIASTIASLTDTPKDDKVVAKLYKIVDLLALNVGKAKMK